jgi:hypothetical protein
MSWLMPMYTPVHTPIGCSQVLFGECLLRSFAHKENLKTTEILCGIIYIQLHLLKKGKTSLTSPLSGDHSALG